MLSYQELLTSMGRLVSVNGDSAIIVGVTSPVVRLSPEKKPLTPPAAPEIHLSTRYNQSRL